MIGILGGTFDPIHNAHMNIAELALQHCQLEHIYFVPCQLPVHRPAAQASAIDRLNMVKLAVETETKFSADDREITRQTPSYMIETLNSFKTEFPDEAIALILGFDAWKHFKSWHEWQTILEHYHLIIVKRPGYRLAHQDLIKQNNAHIIEEADEPVSATQLRTTLKTSPLEAEKSLPKAVFDYIVRQALYQ